MNPAWQTNWIVFIITHTHSHIHTHSSIFVFVIVLVYFYVVCSSFMLIYSLTVQFSNICPHRIRSRIELIVNYLECCSFLVNSTQTQKCFYTLQSTLPQVTYCVLLFFPLYFFLFIIAITYCCCCCNADTDCKYAHRISTVPMTML